MDVPCWRRQADGETVVCVDGQRQSFQKRARLFDSYGIRSGRSKHPSTGHDIPVPCRAENRGAVCVVTGDAAGLRLRRYHRTEVQKGVRVPLPSAKRPNRTSFRSNVLRKRLVLHRRHAGPRAKPQAMIPQRRARQVFWGRGCGGVWRWTPISAHRVMQAA